MGGCSTASKIVKSEGMGEIPRVDSDVCDASCGAVCLVFSYACDPCACGACALSCGASVSVTLTVDSASMPAIHRSTR